MPPLFLSPHRGVMVTKQTRYESDISYELDRHGGVQAKNWRRKVANAARKPPAALMRTLSFPLELTLTPNEFAAADGLYNTVEGFQKGSLGHLLLCAHLSGLSLFQNAAQAASARQQAQFPNAQFVKALEDGLGIVLPELTPQFLLNLFQSAPRKNPPFTGEELLRRPERKIIAGLDGLWRSVASTVSPISQAGHLLGTKHHRCQSGF